MDQKRLKAINEVIHSSYCGTYHECKAEEHHWGDFAPEPQYLTIGNQDNGQILEDGIERDAQVLQALASSVDHGDQS